MKTIEQLQEEHAKQLRKLEKELKTAKSLPVTPRSVMEVKKAPWVSYQFKSLRDCLELFSKFADAGEIMPMEVRRNGCTTVQPFELMEQRYQNGARDGGEYGALLEVSTGEGFGYVELEFYAKGEGFGPVKVSARVTDEYGVTHLHHKLMPRAIDERDRANRLVSRKFAPSNVLNGYADRVLQFSSGDIGPIKKSADFRYLFINDREHIEIQIETLCDELEGK